MPKKYPNLTKEFIENCKNQGLLQKEIAALMGCSRYLIIRVAKRHNITFTKNKIKYPVMEDFFNEWSHDMAYSLGFIMTDGCIRKHKNSFQLKIEVNDKDIEVLEFMRDKISPSRPIRNGIKHKNKSGSISHSADLCITLSEKCFKKLNSYGIIPRKSGKETVPQNMPEEFIWSFIRGVFDGDGSIYKRKQGGFDWGIYSSSETFIRQLEKLISITSKVTKQNQMWNLKVRDKTRIKLIREKLYFNNTFCLKRKYDLLQQV